MHIISTLFLFVLNSQGAAWNSLALSSYLLDKYGVLNKLIITPQHTTQDAMKTFI